MTTTTADKATETNASDKSPTVDQKWTEEEFADLRGQIDAIRKSHAVIEFELDGTIIHANDNFLRTMGYTLSEVQGKHHRMFVCDSISSSPEYNQVWENLRKGQYTTDEFRRIGKDGREIWIQASYNPILDTNGHPYKVVEYATDITSTKQLQKAVAENAQTLSAASQELSAVSCEMRGNAENTRTRASLVSDTSARVNDSVQLVASSMEQMTASIREIAKSASQASSIVGDAVCAADSANATVTKLGTSSGEIGKVVKVINSIAEQTNLLALNATIEAARAGEAGKGFAVVANEVKELAKETAKATEDISHRIEAIQSDTNGAVSAIGEITELINKINEVSSTIASAVEEQSATTGEITRSITDANKGTSEIVDNIESVSSAAESTTEEASKSKRALDELSRMANELHNLVSEYQF